MHVVDLLEHFEGVKSLPSGGWIALCPAHDDRNPSLKIDEGDDGAPLLTCHAGCTATDVLKAVGLSWRDVLPPREEEPDVQPRQVATYPYTDKDGTLLYEVVRMEPKGFRQRRPVDGGWEWNLQGVTRVPYRLPEILAAQKPIYICEGEKDVEAIRDRSGIATCNNGGAGKWDDSFGVFFFEKDVIIVADKDEPGRAHAKAVKGSVSPYAANVRVVEALTGKDAFDHLEAGHGPADFVEVDLDEPVFHFQATDLDEEVPPAPWLLEDLVSKGDVTLLYGPPGAGKTWFSMGLSIAVYQGLPFFLGKNVHTHGRVLYVDEEMPRDLVTGRLKALGLDAEWGKHMRYYWRRGVRLDENPEYLLEDAMAFKPELIVIDSFTRVHRAEENAVESIGKVLSEGILPLARETGAAVLLMHHANKTGSPRGSSDIEAAVDAVLRLEPDEEHEGRFTISQGKTRRARGGGRFSVDIIDGMDGRVQLNPALGAQDWRQAA